jgi:citrate lyase beta subunit
MKLTWVYQYISLNQPVIKILQTLRKCANKDIIPILDIEDSLQIPLQPEKSLMLKEKARGILCEVLSIAKKSNLSLKASIRINSLDSQEFIRDIKVLKGIGEEISWGSIILPKVHSSSILQDYIKELEGIRYDELVVIAESKAFFENSDEIISTCKENAISKIHFGHWDYYYDIKEFPVPLPDDQHLWQQVSLLVRSMESADMHYIHTPYCFLMKHDVFKSITCYIDHITTLPFGVSCLSFSQAIAASRNNENIQPVVPSLHPMTQVEKIIMARELVKFFNRPVPPEFSFNIDTENYRFYAPHEYLNALAFLERSQG